MRYVRLAGRALLLALAVGSLAALQGAALVGILALGGSPLLATCVSFVVIAAVCAGLDLARWGLRRRRSSADRTGRHTPYPRKRLLFVALLWGATSVLTLVTFLRLDAAPMATATDGGDGAAVAIRETGVSASSRNPVVVVHGGPGVPLTPYEEATVERLASDRTVVVYDQAGTGQSQPLADATDYTLRHAVDELADVVASIPADQVDIVGYSWGASIATVYAIENPDRVGQLAFLSPGAIPWRGQSRLDVGPQSRLEMFPLIGTYLLALSPRNLFLYAVTAADPAATRWFAGDSELDSRFGSLYGASAAGLHCDDKQARYSPMHVGFLASQVPQLHPDLDGITKQRAEDARFDMLVLRGDCDYIPDAFAQEYVDVFGATLVRIPGSGHALLQDRPDRTLEEVESFLQ